MGNRVLIQFINSEEVSPVIYGHWSGRDAADVINALREQMADRADCVAYVAARCVGRLIGGETESSTGFGLWNAAERLAAKDSHGDAGIFLVDVSGPRWRVMLRAGSDGERGRVTDSANVSFHKHPDLEVVE